MLFSATDGSRFTNGMKARSMLSRICRADAESRRIGMSKSAVSNW